MCLPLHWCYTKEYDDGVSMLLSRTRVAGFHDED
jgi:hypothetical protein